MVNAYSTAQGAGLFCCCHFRGNAATFSESGNIGLRHFLPLADEKGINGALDLFRIHIDEGEAAPSSTRLELLEVATSLAVASMSNITRFG